jgi:hypothetical protein
MRARRLHLALLTAALLLVGGLPAAATAHAARCAIADSKAVVQGTLARVYTTLTRKGTQYWGCLNGAGHPVALGFNSNDGRQLAGGPVLAGRYVALWRRTEPYYGGSLDVVVFDLRSRRQVHAGPVLSARSPYEQVLSVLLSPNGSVAWLASAFEAGSANPNPGAIEVRKIDARGPVVLDSGPGIALRSLSLNGGMLTWNDFGQTRSATLS